MKRLLAFTLLFASASAFAAPPTLAPLLNSIAERLAIADQVALSKWDSKKPIEDKKREQDVLVLQPDSEFFKFLQGQVGTTRD